jgi:thiamine pyrophosphokinase
MDAWVVAAGEVRIDRFWRASLKKAELIIAADSGWHHLEQMGFQADLLVGDLDSIRGTPEGVEVLSFQSDKDKSDTQLAIEIAFERGAERVWVLGAIGGRLDHTIANMKLLSLFPERLFLIDGDFESVAVRTNFSFSAGSGEVISLFCLACDQAIVSASGLRYPLTKQILRSDSHGLSNVAVDHQVTIQVHRGMVQLVRNTDH